MNPRILVMPALVCALSLLPTLYILRAHRESSRDRLTLKFEAIVKEVSADIEKEIANLANITTAGVAFHNASERVTRREWADYVRTLDLPSLHRGIAALGVNQYVTRAGLADFIAEQRADGEPDFQVKFVNGLRDTPHDDLYVVKYIEPLAPNRKALGFDIGSEETRRRAAEYARDTGLFALTDVITLVQDRRNSPGFLFMKPVYRGGLPTGTVAGRRQAFAGLVCSPFIGDWLLEDVAPELLQFARIRVFNRSATGARELILDGSASGADAGAPAEPLTLERTLPAANKHWIVEARPTAAFFARHDDYHPGTILAGGIALSLLLSLLAYYMSLSVRRSEVRRSASENKYQTLFESSNDAVLITEGNRIRDGNAAALRIFGCADKDVLCWKHPADVSPPFQPCGTPSLQLANERMQAALRDGACRFEWTHRRLNTGEDFPAEVLLSRMELDGRTALQATVRDITTRVRMQEKIAAHQQALQKLTSALFTAEHQERRRIASGLHDDVCQSLVLARLKLGELQAAPPADGDDPRCAELDRLLKGLLETCHSLVFDLASPVLEKLGLVAGLEDLCEQMRSEGGVDCLFVQQGGPAETGGEIGRFLYLSVRELLSNVRKHARAGRVRVVLRTGRGRVMVAVEDDGVGCPASAMEGFSPAGGFGLFSIRERIHHLGGHMNMHLLKPRGTRFVLRIPAAGPAGAS
ncbi:MAG: CHASE domain-containing protein [Kiritimatiellia bacterium]